MKQIVSVDWLAENIGNENIQIIDCRFELGKPDHGLNCYIEEHIPGALYFDLERDMSGKKEEHGGRHPLPNIDEFAEKLSAAGIDHQVTVVAYDDQGGAMASRLWWLLTYLGHQKVYIVDGGFSHWKKQGNAVTNEMPSITRKSFVPTVQEHLVVTMEDVRQKLNDPNTVLIDARETKRYVGEEEHIDPIAGHIPGALNFFWKEGLNDSGLWKNEGEQKERFHLLGNDDKVKIVYCGSGVTACPVILSLYQAGYNQVKLYAGSWSDWCSYKENPVAKEQ
ncbi:sulfurtransferase [Anaerobacillus sp. MEB173]|uniref:sulfurtransferase n=1 Tax=Anaerobacillus sp. MEB173 TaxID=3383345 RepID=UPI003F8FA920